MARNSSVFGIARHAALANAFLKRKLAEYAALQREIESLKTESARQGEETRGNHA